MSTSTLRTVLDRNRVGFWSLAGALTFVLVLAAAASVPIGNAAFPGANGKIAYGLEGSTEIWVMDADGANQTNITNNPALDATPVWSPDGTKIAFNRDSEVYVMDADGSNQVNITNRPLSNEGPSSWSPDGSKILFSSDRDGNIEIYVMNADGSNQERLTYNPAPEYEAAWSPDGSKIAFTEFQDGNMEIYVMNADGTNPVNLTNNPAEDGSPDWSPDGTKIAFNSHRDSPSVMELYVMNADGSNPTNLSNTPGAVEQWPAWSPDGTKIAYSRSGPGGNDIFVMDADGSNPTDLTNTAGANEQDPDWQPLVLDATPPTVTCSATPNSLWPPNHKLRAVTTAVTVSDPDGSGPAGFTLVSVTSNEPDDGPGDGGKPNDIQGWTVGSADTAGSLRAERSGLGTGRVYTLTYEGSDAAGNTARCSTTVTVPHDQGR